MSESRSWDVAEVIERAKAEVLELVTHCVVPHTVASFSELHDHVDANELGGLTRDDCPWWPGGHLEAEKANAVQDAVDAWIKGGALRTTGGLWTPWAEALCVPCHSKVTPAEQSCVVPGATSSDEPGTWDRRGLCSRCGAGIWLPGDVALFTRIKARVGGRLEQTGGMCAALSVVLPTGRYICLTEGGGGDEGWLACIYTSEEAFGEVEALACESLKDGATDEEVIAAVERLKKGEV